MLLDATLAFLHFTAILLLAGFLAAEAMLLRGDLGARDIVTLARSDVGYFASAMLVLATGLARVFFGAKGAAFYADNPFFWAKVGLFLAIGLVSIRPTRAFLGWRRAARAAAGFSVPAADIAVARRYVLVELHLLALMPLAAVLMARGIGYW
jgi:putative membrane protein